MRSKKSGLPFEVIIVDDGSSHGTASVIDSYREQIPVTLHRHEVNQGSERDDT
jgi:glycosyltransferase involved in cell wall biosynthesis